MKKFLITIILFSFVQVKAQENIKKIIFEDLLSLNELYDNCLLRFDQTIHIIKDTDTLIDIKTIDDLKNNFEDRVAIINIDSNFNFYRVKVSFLLYTQSGLYPFLFSENTFSRNEFEYILYKSDGRFYKVNGFLVSDILSVSPENLYDFREYIRLKAPKKLFNKYLPARNIDKISKYLSISIMEKIVDQGFSIYHRPYIKDIICR